MSFKKNLLKWVQNQTSGPTYKLKIKGFKSDWKNGLAFVAMLHSFDPNAFEYSDFKAEEDAKNLEYAFNNAKSNFDIDNILDVDDITDFRIPDDILIITYLTLWYQFYAKNKRKIAINASRPKRKKKPTTGNNQETFDKMKGLVKKKNDQRAKANWNFIKDHVKKIEIDFEKVADELEDEFGDIETPVFFSPSVTGARGSHESLFDPNNKYENVLEVTERCVDALKLFCERKLLLCPVMITKGKYFYEPKHAVKSALNLPKDLVDRYGKSKFPRYMLVNGDDESSPRFLVYYCPEKIHSKTKLTYDENLESFVGAVCAKAGFTCVSVKTANLGEVSMQFLKRKV